MKRTFPVLAVFLLISAFAWAGGRGEILPQVEMLIPEIVYISPANQDNVQDNLAIPINAAIRRGGFPKGYALYVYDDIGNTVRTISERDPVKWWFLLKKNPVSIPELILWDGRDDAGNFVSDGKYIFEIRIWDERHNASSGKRKTVVVDNTPPFSMVSLPVRSFRPNGDGNMDTLLIKQWESSSQTWWVGGFYSESDEAFEKRLRNFVWSGRIQDFEWDGRDDRGNILPDGRYTYRLSSTDRAGNTFSTVEKGIVLDTKPANILVYVGDNGFSPNNDGFKDTMTINLRASDVLGIKNWELSIYTVSGEKRRTYSGTGRFPAFIDWDGRGDRGTILEGAYSAAFSIDYERGHQLQARTQDTFVLDISPPEIEISASPIPFAPDTDGQKSTLEVATRVTDPSGLSMWRMDILDPRGSLFLTRVGVGNPPERFIWDGRSDRGELVQSASDYTILVSVTDQYGNSARKNYTLPVDILVFREGDKLKIIISSIHFKSYSADYLDLEPALRSKNLETIELLAQTLKRYPEYNIVIEGHAVALLWDRPERERNREQTETLLPLSRERAEAIKKALVALGLEPSRITTLGYGGLHPVVPHRDLDNRWKNRRVEFILVKP